MTTPQDPPAADLEQARRWLATLHGDAPGLINIVSTGNWVGEFYPTDDAGLDAAVSYIARLDRQQRAGIYARVTTLSAAPPPGRRGLADLSLSFPGFWADLDIAGPGHKTTEKLPATVDDARRIIDTSPLPEPTMWIHSGGGLYPWWLLTDRHQIEPGGHDDIGTLTARWQLVILAASEQLGYSYGQGVGDLSRVLRVPGTINRKTALGRECRILEGASGVTYTLDELAILLYTIDLPDPQPPAHREPPTRPQPANHTPGTIGPFDALDEVCEWRDLFEPYGLTYVGSERDGAELWRRDGASSAYSIRAWPHVCVNHSEALDLPSGAGHRLTHGKVFAHWHHHGDTSAAATDLIRAAAGHPDASPAARSLRPAILDHIRQRCTVRPWTPNTPPDDVPFPDAPTDHITQIPMSTRTGEDPPWPDDPNRGDHTTDAQIMAGLYIDANAARAHFKDDAEDVEGSGAKPPPLDVATMLPVGLRNFVTAVAEHLQVPVEAPALISISILSAATSGRVVVDGRNGWRQPSIVWTATTMHSGERKTDVVRLAAAPLRQIEQRMIAEYLDGVQTFKRDKADLEAQDRDLKQELRRARGADRARVEQDLMELQVRIEEMPADAGPMPAVLVEDITVEALSQRLDENGQALGVISDEGGVFSLIAGRYSKDNGPNLDLYLKAYDQSPVRVDRVMRGSLMLTKPSLVVGILAQPHVLEKAAGIDGAMERGLMGRFFLVFPESTLGKRQIDTPPISPVVAARWEAVVAHAYSLRACQDEEPHVLAIEDGAHSMLRELRMRLEPHLEPVVGRYAHMTDWVGKLAGKVLRLAGVFHLADGRPVAEPISAATMNHAIAFGIWSLRHAEHIYASWQKRAATPAGEGTEWVLEWLKRTGKTEFTLRDAQQGAKRTKWYTAATLQTALCGLVRSRHLASCARLDGAGRRQATGMFLVRGDQ